MLLSRFFGFPASVPQPSGIGVYSPWCAGTALWDRGDERRWHWYTCAMAKKLSAHGIGAGPHSPVDWKCEGCGWVKSAAPARPDPTRPPAEVQMEFDAHRCEDYSTSGSESLLADFHAVDFAPNEGGLPGRGQGHVYILCWKANGRDVPFYVGQMNRLRERMGDYQSGQFVACTDFRVGEAIRYLRDQRSVRIVIRHKESRDPVMDEYTLIRDLQLSGLRLLNSLPSYDYLKADHDEERRTVQRFCEMLLANQPL